MRRLIHFSLFMSIIGIFCFVAPSFYTVKADTSPIQVKLKKEDEDRAKLYTIKVSSNNTSKGIVYIANPTDANDTSKKEGTYKYGSIVTVVAQARPGYKFLCWLDGIYSVGSNSSAVKIKVTENMALKAVFVSNKFSGIYPYFFVLLDAGKNGGKFSNGRTMARGKVNPDVTNKLNNLPKDTPTKKGCKFIGWNTKANGMGQWVNENTVIEGCRVFYAIYQKISKEGSDSGLNVRRSVLEDE